MTPKKKICAGKGKYADIPGCGKLNYIFSNGLCKGCIPKTPIQANSGTISPQRGNVSPVRRTALKQGRKPTGELQVFMEIWQERAHVSEISGEPLPPMGSSLWINCFSHILPKSTYGRFRLEKDNIKLVLPSQHASWELYKSDLRDLPQWKWVFEKEEELKQKYHRLKREQYG